MRYIGLIFGLVFSLSFFSCVPTLPPQETTVESTTEPATEKAPTESTSTENTEMTDAGERLPEQAQESIPENPSPLAWDTPTFQQTVAGGRFYTLTLPTVTGGKPPYQYALLGTPDGVTLTEKGLSVRLAYGTTSPLTFAVQAKDSQGQEAKLDITLTQKSPQWTALSSAEGPAARANPAFALTSRHLFVLGGYLDGGSGSNDVWAWDRKQSTWQQATATGDLPPKAGTFRWVIKRSTEEQVEGLLLQGMSSQNDPYNDVYAFVWKPGSIAWTKLVTEGSAPYDLILSAVGHDSKKDRTYLFGGLLTSFGSPSADLFSLQIVDQKAIWTKHSPPLSPPARYGAQFVMDEKNARLFVVSGTGKSGTLQDAWWLSTSEMGDPVWKEIQAEGRLSGRQNGALFYDAEGNRLFVWGGAAGGVAPISLFALCLDDPKPRWEEVGSLQAPGSRTSIYSVSDATTGESFVGFGRNPNFLRDLWSFQPNPQ